MIALKNILVATDFSKPSEPALEYGRELARTFGATLHVLHVLEWVPGYIVDAGYVAFPDLEKEIEDAARKELGDLVTDDDRRTLNAKTILRTFRSPAAAIAEYAKEAGIDLIVVGTHGRSALARVLLGSVAENVVRIAPCPVLTVRSPEHDFLLPDALTTVAKA